MSLDQIALTYQGKQVAFEDACTLRSCNLEPGCTVHLVGRLRGGGGYFRTLQSVQFVDVEEMSLLQKFRLEPNQAPEWKVSEEGFSVEGECWNEECVAYRQMMICNLNFAVFNLQDEVHCPLCAVAVRALTCGFRKCLWMFEGRKRGAGNVDVASQWMKAGNLYKRFDEGAERSTAAWDSLIVTAKKLPSPRSLKDFHGSGDCPICHEEFTASPSQCTSKCKHAFHRDCVMAWQVRGNSTCPLCRDSFE